MTEDDADKPDDAALFRAAMADARPLHSRRVQPDKPRPRPVARQRHADDAAVLRESLDAAPEDIETGDELYFCRPGIQHAAVRKLKRGQIRIEAELDLHGLTADRARAIVDEFLHDCREVGIRAIRIIHGKGKRSGPRGPVLKRQLASWLRRRDAVLAYCSARPVDGGTGAVYVLLRR